MNSIKMGASFAATAAILALSAATPVIAKDAKAETVHCYGVNSCKGTSDCKTSANDCKGMNVCKGHGFKEMTAKACTAAGGMLTEAK
ncbi:hypothetical protein QUC32_09385 [Novosphingobium resinovorum]|uniref:BufA2 family periplasmic bufferin-type metallophore n=1 Tax=Novosphingobium TaxID=165696 RepID=UPI001B3C9BC1|nr:MULTISPECIES: hypothetical protein [Novosphingobium]MBF7014180.1 hypothetical protein [Novosphingobium sp. HR1a]WJM25344.1 hypothetical protein QUC32_09385 [Novosphingobium resinovorum]